jgi:hypothetical protein
LRHRILSPARLPIPSPRQVFAVEILLKTEDCYN